MTDEQLARALRAYRRAESALEDRRGELFNVIGEAVIHRGIRQADVARQTGYTREHIRRICNAYVSRQEGHNPPLESAQ